MCRMLPHPFRYPSKHKLERFQSVLLAWYRAEGRHLPWRKPGQSVYRMITCELLLQRTRAETVAGVYKAFFARYGSWNSLSLASVKELGEALRPLGLWRRRARSMSELSRVMKARGGKLPSSRSEIEALPGVGQYIANAIELIRWQKARPLIDVNMARVLERNFGPRSLADIRFDPNLQRLAQRVVRCDQPLQVNWAILDLAALICTRQKPACSACPLREGCRFRRLVTRKR